MMLYKNTVRSTKTTVRSPDRDIDFFNIVGEVL